MPPPLPIAIVEDHEDLRDDLSAFFINAQFEVSDFADGEAFLAAFETDRFSLVILDINLPGLNGFEVAQQVRTVNRTVPIVILSCDDSSHSYISGMRHGADVYLDKSASMEMVVATCERLISRHNEMAIAEQEKDKETPAVWRLDQIQQQLHCPNGGLIKLTENETELVALFANSRSENIDKKVLIEALGKETTGSYEVILSRLRKKVKTEVRLKLPVRTQYGRGYQWYEEIQQLG